MRCNPKVHPRYPHHPLPHFSFADREKHTRTKGEKLSGLLARPVHPSTVTLGSVSLLLATAEVPPPHSRRSKERDLLLLFHGLVCPTRMGECSEYRCWEELLPDALGLIFRNLSLHEVLTVVPRVCKSWSRVIAGPYCWQEIDIQEWSQQQSKPDHLTRMVHMLIARSGGSFHRISVSGLPSDSLFTFIAGHARSLKTMELPRSEISDSIVEDVAPRLSNVTFLDVSSCTKIGARALEAFGKHCKSLIGLRRVMHPIDVAGKVCQHDEARAIACSMPKLRHLEIGYMLIATKAVVEIASQCHDLKFLDLRGCWGVDDKFLQERYPGLKVLGPRVDDCYENSFWEECSDDSDDSIYSWEFMDDDYYAIESDDEGIWDDGQGLEGLEVRFYGGGFGESYAGFDWPPSP